MARTWTSKIGDFFDSPSGMITGLVLATIMGLRQPQANRGTGITWLDNAILALPILLVVFGLGYLYMSKGKGSKAFNFTMLISVLGSAAILSGAGFLAAKYSQPEKTTTESENPLSSISITVTNTAVQTVTNPPSHGGGLLPVLGILAGILVLGFVIIAIRLSRGIKYTGGEPEPEISVPPGYHVPFEPVSEDQQYILERYWYLSSLLEEAGAPDELSLSPREFEVLSSKRLGLQRKLLSEVTKMFELAGFSNHPITHEHREAFDALAQQIESFVSSQKEVPSQ